VLIDATDVYAVKALLAAHFTGNVSPFPAMQISWGIYELMWDLAQSDIASS
jgi:hypothetical protein